MGVTMDVFVWFKEIPSLRSVTQAISVLCKQTEVSMKIFVYIKFPFGLMDYS